MVGGAGGYGGNGASRRQYPRPRLDAEAAAGGAGGNVNAPM